MKWIDANKELPGDNKNYYITYDEIDSVVGDKMVIKELIENGWLDVKWLDEGQSDSEAVTEKFGEWQLCPKCFGDGHLGRHNPPAYMSTTVTPLCDVCNGNKIIKKPAL